MKKRILTILMCMFCVGVITTEAAKTKERKPTALSNPKASKEARQLFAELIAYKKMGKILSGQMWSPWGGDEVEYLYKTTGKYPAVRGHDLIIEANNENEIKLLIEWYRKGGIPTLMWHWGAPTQGEGYEQSKQTIDIAKCFVDGTPEHKAMWDDLNRVGKWLTILRDEKVPVLWRPLHEFDGRWFWYGKGSAQDFIQLWRTMYDYFTKDLKLNNLIWVLPHSQEFRAECDPGRAYYDLAGADSYDTNNQKHLYQAVQETHGAANLLIPLHECGVLPDPDQCAKDGMMWSWWMLWHTNFVRDHDKEQLKRIYNHPLILTLDELKRAQKNE